MLVSVFLGRDDLVAVIHGGSPAALLKRALAQPKQSRRALVSTWFEESGRRAAERSC